MKNADGAGVIRGTFPNPEDADLHAIADAWPTLPEALKAGILAMVRAAGEECKP